MAQIANTNISYLFDLFNIGVRREVKIVLFNILKTSFKLPSVSFTKANGIKLRRYLVWNYHQPPGRWLRISKAQGSERILQWLVQKVHCQSSSLEPPIKTQLCTHPGHSHSMGYRQAPDSKEMDHSQLINLIWRQFLRLLISPVWFDWLDCTDRKHDTFWPRKIVMWRQAGRQECKRRWCKCVSMNQL